MNQGIYHKLKELKPILKEKYGIEEFALFGSMAKGTYDENSDVDIVILNAKNHMSYFDLIDAENFLKEKLNKDVDMGFLDGMKTFIKNRIKKDFIYV